MANEVSLKKYLLKIVSNLGIFISLIIALFIIGFALYEIHICGLCSILSYNSIRIGIFFCIILGIVIFWIDGFQFIKDIILMLSPKLSPNDQKGLKSTINEGNKENSELQSEKINNYENKNCEQNNVNIKFVEENEKIDPELFKIYEINSNQLNEYYRIVGEQSTNSLKYAILMSFFGFTLIIFGVYQLKDSRFDMQSLTIIGGIVSEIISGLGFNYYFKTLKERSKNQKKLIDIQYLLISINLISKIDDANEEKAIRLKIIDECIRKICH
nr:hypothetical protein [uncultured Methanospirillum sp.]